METAEVIKDYEMDWFKIKEVAKEWARENAKDDALARRILTGRYGFLEDAIDFINHCMREGLDIVRDPWDSVYCCMTCNKGTGENPLRSSIVPGVYCSDQCMEESETEWGPRYAKVIEEKEKRAKVIWNIERKEHRENEQVATHQR